MSMGLFGNSTSLSGDGLARIAAGWQLDVALGDTHLLGVSITVAL